MPVFDQEDHQTVRTISKGAVGFVALTIVLILMALMVTT